MHLIDKRVGMAGTSAIVGGAVPIAVGAALAAQMKGEDRVVVVFLGDATTEEGRDVGEPELRRAEAAAGRSSSARTTSTRCSRRWRRASRARDHSQVGGGVRDAVGRVDGMNVLAVARRRQGARSTGREPAAGPTFIEAPVYRFRAHGGAGDDSQHRLSRRGRARGVGAVLIRSRCSAST